VRRACKMYGWASACCVFAVRARGLFVSTFLVGTVPSLSLFPPPPTQPFAPSAFAPGSMSLPTGALHETVASGGDFKEPPAAAPQQMWADNKLQLQSPPAASAAHDTPQPQAPDMHAHQGAHADPMTQSSSQMNPYVRIRFSNKSCWGFLIFCLSQTCSCTLVEPPLSHTPPLCPLAPSPPTPFCTSPVLLQ
jgi:hypothetical protein